MSLCDLARSHRFAGYVMLTTSITDAGTTYAVMYSLGVPVSSDMRLVMESKSSAVHSSTVPWATTDTETVGKRSTLLGLGGKGGDHGNSCGGDTGDEGERSGLTIDAI
jgi:hypothetical protein